MALFLSIVALAIGGGIYLSFRSDTLLMFRWTESLQLNVFVENLRQSMSFYAPPDFVKYSLPDGLWLFSYMFLVDAIWNGSKSISAYIFIYYLPFLALMSEFLQYLGLVPGVFDWIDVASYLFAILLYITIKLV